MRCYTLVKRYGFSGVMTLLLGKLGLASSEAAEKVKTGYYEKLTPEGYADELKYWFKALGWNDDIENPQTFNGKIQWLKLHDSTPLKTRLADKYLVREWIDQKLPGGGYCVPLLGVYERFEQIDFSSLPEKFVIKANHGSGMNIIVKDKNSLDLEMVKRQTDQWMNTVFGYEGMEIHYFNIPRRLIIEEYMEQMDGDLYDYKLHCFNGEPELIQVIGERDPKNHTGREAFYDADWNLTPYRYTYPAFDHDIKKPENLEELLRTARKLSEGFIYVRVDLYLLDQQIKFGEMTFTPARGADHWQPAEADYIIGNMLRLPNV